MDVCGKLGKPACNRIERLESVGRCGARPSARRCLAVAIGSEGGCPLSYRGKALSLGPGGVAARWTMEPNLARVPIPGGEPEGPSAGAGASPCLASPVQLSRAPSPALRKRTGQARLAAGRSLIRDTAGGPNAGGRFQVRCQQRDPCTESVGSDNPSRAADALGNVWYHRSCSVEDANAMQPNGLHPVCSTATEAAKPSSYFTSYFNLAALASLPEPPPNCPVPPYSARRSHYRLVCPVFFLSYNHP